MFGLEYEGNKLFWFMGDRGKGGLIHRFLIPAPDASTAQLWAAQAFGGDSYVGRVSEVKQEELFGTPAKLSKKKKVWMDGFMQGMCWLAQNSERVSDIETRGFPDERAREIMEENEEEIELLWNPNGANCAKAGR